MSDKMSDIKVHVTDEQPCLAAGGDSTTQTKMHTGQDENVHVAHHTNIQVRATKQQQ